MVNTIKMLLNAGLLLLLVFGLSGCKEQPVEKSDPVRPTAEAIIPAISITNDMAWSERMALSIMKRAPEAWMNDFQEKPRWNYTLGLVLNAMMEVGEAKNKPVYFDYAKAYGDTMIYADGTIRDYSIENFNIDHVAPGPLMFALYQKTGEKKYRTAIETLHRQLTWQPRTTEGGYWHKLRYPWQMWLDGLFMGEPFHAEYAKAFDRPELYDHIAHQFSLAEAHLRDEETGLLYHGWDESGIQAWANKETGQSPHFWARAIGWYCMGLVDVLEFFPTDHPQRKELIAILDRTLQAVLKVQDPVSNTWWQVMDMPGKEGNYLESTASCMFTYAMIRGVNEGLLDEKYRQLAEDSYSGILKTFIEVEESGEIHLTKGCAVAGLGGSPYRDGTFEYYVGEPVRNNDPKGIGPFMRASLEMERSANSSKL